MSPNLFLVCCLTLMFTTFSACFVSVLDFACPRLLFPYGFSILCFFFFGTLPPHAFTGNHRRGCLSGLFRCDFWIFCFLLSVASFFLFFL